MTNKEEKKQYEQLGKMLVSIYETGYLDKAKFYKMNFIKGLVAGFGGVIGATIVVALLLWILSLFQEIPIIGPLVDNLRGTLQENGN